MTAGRVFFLGVSLFAAGFDASAAQSKPPRAEVTAVVNTSPVRAGSSTQLALKVRLPDHVHVQSDKPRDPLLIPTALTMKVPTGVSVDRIVYPKATDLAQAGRKEPLTVLSGEFTIEARITLAPDIQAGQVIVPGQLRYQACDPTMCYAPARADVQWTLRVTRGGPGGRAE